LVQSLNIPRKRKTITELNTLLEQVLVVYKFYKVDVKTNSLTILYTVCLIQTYLVY